MAIIVLFTQNEVDFLWMQDEDVEVWNLLIENLISKYRKKMSAQNQPEREICIKKARTWIFSKSKYQISHFE